MKDQLNFDYHSNPLGISFNKGDEYIGKVKALSNDSNHYALIYERQIKALSGPPICSEELLESGKISEINEGLLKRVFNVSMKRAEAESEKNNFKLINDYSKIFSLYKRAVVSP